MAKARRGLYANIHAKRKRIKAGSGEKMRKPGQKGRPTAKAFKQSAKTAKKRRRKCLEEKGHTVLKEVDHLKEIKERKEV